MSAGTRQLHRLERAFATLDPQTREVFLAHRVEGLGYGEIAARLGIPLEAVDRNVADALYQLASQMERRERPW